MNDIEAELSSSSSSCASSRNSLRTAGGACACSFSVIFILYSYYDYELVGGSVYYCNCFENRRWFLLNSRALIVLAI